MPPKSKGRSDSNFTKETIDFLRDEVGNRCSLCDRPTSGPSRQRGKRTNVGTAAHITAAARGGPRHDRTLTPAQRRSPENGIWCCRDCGKLVDDDTTTYSVAQLNAKKKDAIDLAHDRVTAGVIAPRMSEQRRTEIIDLRIRWDDELESMEEFYERAWRVRVSLARELEGWDTPFWTTRHRQLARVFGKRDWWSKTANLYRLWKEARRYFPTLERYVKPTMSTGHRLERAVDKFRAAQRAIVDLRRCLAVEAELETISERDRADAIRICEAGAESTHGTYVGFAKELGIDAEGISCRLAKAAWNFSCGAPSHEQDAAAAKLLRTGWIPSVEVMLIEGQGGGPEFKRLLKTQRALAAKGRGTPRSKDADADADDEE